MTPAAKKRPAGNTYDSRRPVYDVNSAILAVKRMRLTQENEGKVAAGLHLVVGVVGRGSATIGHDLL